ncbi:DNA polymerase III subunit epsilon [Allochromatium vinosum]|uniref:DNA polymerase III subunit epsilon n=1 Tax=Allochromatium vinosum TaxID=1049 RepID=UPI001908DB0C|nr:DNA polymerase III subunit epsilon [Allochromatium vinosum]MBK1654694.1 DNA polymerase III subunit epsilon [Allochromatium vinosum]
MRQIVLDTETTGLEPREGHRIIEIGCVELVDRRPTGRNFHEYLNPERQIDAEAEAVHGISNAFLADKPRFAERAERLVEYLRGAELIIHNAAFDVGFLDHEFGLWRGAEAPRIADLCTVTDSLLMARKLHPGQRNGLDALCKRYAIDNSHRTLHGALLDAEILADVYLAMTGGQVSLYLGGEGMNGSGVGEGPVHRGRLDPDRPRLRVVRATQAELEAHRVRLDAIRKASGGCVWLGGTD